MRTLIKNALIINEMQKFTGSVMVNDKLIEAIYRENDILPEADKIIDAKGLWLIPGVIDDQVHFREPGLTHKADIQSESRAAAAGGVTSYMEMPNTIPQTITQQALDKKFEIAAEKSLINYSFYMGATNDNIDELVKTDPKKICGIKMFMGSSTGNMLVNDNEAIENVFKHAPLLVATHCEEDSVIEANFKHYKKVFGENIPFNYHPDIRSEEACYRSSSKAVELASKHNSRLHILHLSTQKELSLFTNYPLSEKRITAEACVHHLWFNREDYNEKGSRIKWNPAVKEESDRIALIEALNCGVVDIVATDHAPHTIEDKNNTYTKAPSGGPLVQHSLPAMMELANKGYFTAEKVIDLMCHKPAELFQIQKRGYIRKGYYADLVLLKPEKWEVNKSNILYKCRWSPFEGEIFNYKVIQTIINGKTVFHNNKITPQQTAMPLVFNR
ncbi:MAG TPA: dihydroorotase [Bacteroidales bacterium]|jgi:dihydroorotase|nr:dihydroorotase [Bacteroidales bacterium]MDD4234493.1 dihydroorotase [Bacteroidales bacterium]MDY0159814.1 dihydroorotase [Bacteroidales bacterium]HRW20347.1 dihydroorotase [Bacteroidales bacterium]HXK80656.1 dihydroorotase [Bacteroidales bacterium]